MSRLDNKVAIITGASRGIGEAAALALAAKGVHLALVSRSAEALNALAEKCRKRGIKALAIAADLSDPASTKDIVTRTSRELGGVNILINNAGSFSKATTDKADLNEWDRVIDLNLRSLIHLTRHSLSEMEKSDWGAVINISSIAGKSTFRQGGIYNATKFGVVGFTGALFEDVREKNIKVCDICPGFINTELVTGQGLDRGKMIQTEDIARTILFVLEFPDTGCPTEIIVRPQRTPYC